MNLRRALPWIESVALHLVLLALLLVAVPWSTLVVGSHRPRRAPTVHAHVVSRRAVARAWRAYRARREAAVEARAAKLAALAAAARKAAAERKAEEAKLAALRQAALQAKAARARALAAQKQAELVRARARAAKLAALAAARARAETEARAEARALASAAAARAAARGRVLNAWVAAIRRRVEGAWIPPRGTRHSLRCVVYVTLAPGGVVLSARLGSCSGDPAERESIVAAVYRASPLPMPADPADFVSHLRFLFEPGV